MSDNLSPSCASAVSALSAESAQPTLYPVVSKAAAMVWNNQYNEASELLRRKKDIHPRYALEWANMGLVKSLMSSTNADRERLLDLFKEADTLATACKYNAPMFSDEDEDEDEDDDAEEDGATQDSASQATSTATSTAAAGTGGVAAMDGKAMRKAAEKARKKNKKAFRARKKQAAKSGVFFDQAWQLECEVIYADALLLRAICQLMMNSYIKGGINLRKAWGCYYALIQTVEKDTSGSIPHELKMFVKYGTGTFYAFLALVPANLMKLLSLIGFISDKDLGEQYLTEVFESNSLRSPFAALVLCTFYLFLPTGLGSVEETLGKAKRILDVMNTRYPDNTYFHGYANFYYRKRGETENAVRSIKLAASNAERAGLVPLLITYLYADTLFMDQQWAAALKLYRDVLDHLERTNEKFAYTGQVVLSVAACHVMLGHRDEAISWVQKVGTMYNPKSKNDANSPRFAARVLANPRLLPLSGVYMLYINRDLAHMNHEQGQRVLSELRRVTAEADLSGPEAENMYNLFMGVIQKGSGSTTEALSYLQKVLDNEKSIPQDSMVLPFAYYEVGEIEYRLGHLERARDLFEKGRKLKGDGNETLANRYNIAMKQLKRRMDGK